MIRTEAGIQRWNTQRYDGGKIIGSRKVQQLEITFSIMTRTNFKNDSETGFEGEVLARQQNESGAKQEKLVRYRVRCPSKANQTATAQFSVDGSFTDIIDSQETPLEKDLLRATCEDPEA